MKATIITGVPGSGKSSVLPLLAERLSGRVAVIDGDSVARVTPLHLSRDWKDLAQSNIAACAANFRDFGVDHFIAAWVLQTTSDRTVCYGSSVLRNSRRRDCAQDK